MAYENTSIELSTKEEIELIEPVMVVCLGQSLLPNGEVPVALSHRVERAAELCLELSSNVYISGADVAGTGIAEAEVMFQLLVDAGLESDRIHVDLKARNTIENAVNLIPVLYESKAKTVMLVTSDFHIPRAMLVFKSVLKENDFDVVLKAEPAISGLINGSLRPWRLREREINEWRFTERIEHERELIEKRMKAWLEAYGIGVHSGDLDTAVAELQKMMASV